MLLVAICLKKNVTVRRSTSCGRGSGRGRCVHGRSVTHGMGHGRDMTTCSEGEWQNGRDFEPAAVEFNQHVGVDPDINTNNFTALDFVQLFITNDIIKHIVEQTNLRMQHRR